jgi:hypothetical protein
VASVAGKFQLPYPEGTDPPAGHAQIKALAEKVSSSLEQLKYELDTLSGQVNFITGGSLSVPSMTVTQALTVQGTSTLNGPVTLGSSATVDTVPLNAKSVVNIEALASTNNRNTYMIFGILSITEAPWTYLPYYPGTKLVDQWARYWEPLKEVDFTIRNFTEGHPVWNDGDIVRVVPSITGVADVSNQPSTGGVKAPAIWRDRAHVASSGPVWSGLPNADAAHGLSITCKTNNAAVGGDIVLSVCNTSGEIITVTQTHGAQSPQGPQPHLWIAFTLAVGKQILPGIPVSVGGSLMSKAATHGAGSGGFDPSIGMIKADGGSLL